MKEAAGTWFADFFKEMARILVIDDDAGMRTVIGQALKEAGHEVVLAPDGKEGMKEHHVKPVDLIITDLFMPEQDGLETIIALKKQFPNIPVIAISGGNILSTDMLSVARALGADGILEKPFTSKSLLSAVEKVLKAESHAV
jgi:CheY-like chemotaxis protein